MDESENDKPLEISFCGAGFMAIYHVGVLKCIQDHAPHLLKRVKTISGASSGSLIAVWVACNLNISDLLKWMEDTFRASYNYRLGVINPWYNIYRRIRQLLEQHLPRDAHLRVRGRIGIAITTLPYFKTVIISDPTTRKELIDAILISGFLPGYTQFRMPFKFRGKYCIDGGALCNCPGWDDPDRNIITISPFRGGCDICPVANSCSPHLNTTIGFPYQLCMENLSCVRKSLYPVSVEELKEALPNAYRDTLRFLKTEGVLADSIMRPLAMKESTKDLAERILREVASG